MKFFRYKQACRLTFNGLDDELNNVASSYYITKYKLLNNTEINTKFLRFRIENLRDVKLSQNAKLILETSPLYYSSLAGVVGGAKVVPLRGVGPHSHPLAESSKRVGACQARPV